jgi:hypothetical protein
MISLQGTINGKVVPIIRNPFHACDQSVETYNIVEKILEPTVKGFSSPGWYLHIEDNGIWSKINYCPYCGEELR